MNNLIRGVGCVVLTCILFACPICLALLLALGKAAEYGLFTKILAFSTILEFAYVVFQLFFKYDKEN